jgi:hypothetical protein
MSLRLVTDLLETRAPRSAATPFCIDGKVEQSKMALRTRALGKGSIKTALS